MARTSEEAKVALQRLGSLLHILRDLTLNAKVGYSDAAGDGRALAVLCQGGKLALYRRKSNGLPEELLHAFD